MRYNATQCKTTTNTQSKAKQTNAKQCKAEQNKVEQSKAKQGKATRRKARQSNVKQPEASQFKFKKILNWNHANKTQHVTPTPETVTCDTSPQETETCLKSYAEKS